jgi:hypothetical protein
MVDENGVVRIVGTVTFTDPNNQPAFNGGTITGNTTFKGLFEWLGTDNNNFVEIDPGTAAWTQQTVPGTTAGAAWIDATGQRQFFIFEDAAGALMYTQIADGTEAMWIRSDALTELRPVIIQNAAPADGALSTGQAALWFDQTNGASALKVKAKQADGTVKTATVPLS